MFRRADAGDVWCGECAFDGGDDDAAWIVGAWAVVASGFFLSIMFPTIFALGLKGPGTEYEAGGVAAGDGDRWRGDFSAGAWLYCEDYGESGEGVYRAAVRVCRVALYGFLAPRIQPSEVVAAPQVI